MSRKKIIPFICLCSLFLASCQTTPIESGDNTPFEMIVFNNNKADAIVIKTKSALIVVDTGLDDDANQIIDYLNEHEIKTIDYMIITHFDKDHVGGADKIVNAFDVENILVPDYESTSKQYVEFIDACSAKNIKPTRLFQNQSLEIDGITFAIFPTFLVLDEDNDNDHSIVIKVTYGENKVLLAGDAEKPRINEMLRQLNLQSTVLKMPHHGRIEDNTQALINATNPQYAIITCSKADYPDAEVLEMLYAKNIEVFLNMDGNIILTISRDNIVITQ